MTAINRQPTGWLGFLGIKNFGRNPANTSEILSPTWDLQELYYSANRIYATVGATITATGLYIYGQVPPGEVWYVEAFCGITNALAAGNAVDIEAALTTTPSGISLSIGGTAMVLPAVVGGRATAKLAKPILLQPGESLGIWCNQHAGAGLGLTMNICYTRLPA